MVVKFFTFNKFHNKKQTGSTMIRVENLIERWPEASKYKYGEQADVIVFQKVYCAPDYKVPATFDAIRILDICDPDWFDNAYIKETVDGVHAVACSTEPMAEFIRQLTDKPVKVIRDRFIVEDFPKPIKHTGKAKKLVWFGYRHNAPLLKYAIKVIEQMGLELTIIANENPMADKWAEKPDDFKYTYVKFDQHTLYSELQKHDIALLPKGNRPEDKYKSENKTIIANLCGLPVATDIDELNLYMDSDKRNQYNITNHARLMKEYDVRNSVEDYKQLIKEVADGERQNS